MKKSRFDGAPTQAISCSPGVDAKWAEVSARSSGARFGFGMTIHRPGISLTPLFGAR